VCVLDGYGSGSIGHVMRLATVYLDVLCCQQPCKVILKVDNAAFKKDCEDRTEHIADALYVHAKGCMNKYDCA